MTEQEFTEIYSDLLQLTKSKKIQWKRTNDDAYIVTFSRSSVSLGLDNEYGASEYYMRIYNEDGLLIVAAPVARPDAYSDRVRQFSLDPSDLYRLVEAQIFKYSETSRNILDELRQLQAS